MQVMAARRHLTAFKRPAEHLYMRQPPPRGTLRYERGESCDVPAGGDELKHAVQTNPRAVRIGEVKV